MRAKFFNPGADTLGIRWQIERPQRANFAIADEAVIRLHGDDGAIENSHGLATGPFVSGFMQREIDLIGENTSNFHERIRSRF